MKNKISIDWWAVIAALLLAGGVKVGLLAKVPW